MAIQYTTTAGTLTIPGAYWQSTVQASNSSLGTNGVIAIVGEADGGPDQTLEPKLSLNVFAPNDLSAVVAKYRSGPIVDMLNALAAPANDPNIKGAPNSVLIVKTNHSTKAAVALLNNSAVAYGSLTDKGYGILGNSIYEQVTAGATINSVVTPGTPEVAPTTGPFTVSVAAKAYTANFRANGGAVQSLSVTAGESPTNIVAGINALTGVAATGGVIRNAGGIGSTGSVVMAVNIGGIANAVTFTTTTTWATNPTVGDTLAVLLTGSMVTLGGGNTTNAGSYVVTSVSNTVIGATKVADDTGATSANVGIPTNPIGSTAHTGVQTDLNAWSPITISNYTGTLGNVIDGVGKTLSICEIGTPVNGPVSSTGVDGLSNNCYVLGTTTKVSWVDKTSFTAAQHATAMLSSASEQVVVVSINRNSTNSSEAPTAGGEIALRVSYTGTTATFTVGSTTITSAVTGGVGAALPAIALKAYPTIGDLVAFINSQPGWQASAGTGILALLPLAALDEGVYGCGSNFGAMTGSIKIDAYRFQQRIAQGSSLTNFLNASGVAAPANQGLPAPQALPQFLTGGARGATAQADIQNAANALMKTRVNFVVPLFSQDATADIVAGNTDPGSTYTIDSINAVFKSHVLAASTYLKRRNRQAFLSKDTTFATAQTSSANIASYRCTFCFQDANNLNASGSLVQFQSWMTAGLAAGMQAAGFYKAIFGKGINASSFLQAAGDFDDQDDNAVTSALLAGLLTVRQQEDGSWQFVSDQTTYGADSNFVFNSVQATYANDLIGSTTASRMEKAFKGQSVADVSATLALAFLDAIMADLMRLKLIAPSTGAPRGYKSAKIQILGPVMLVEVTVFLAGAIYFVPISFLVQQVTQSASS